MQYKDYMWDDKRSEEELLKELHGSHVLTKSINDPFYYAVRLKDGAAFRFEYARGEEGSEFITFCGLQNISGVPEALMRLTQDFYRGLEVRKDQIVWIADGNS
jgi:hypothetical protein